MHNTHEYAYQNPESMSDRMDREYRDMVARDEEAKEEGTLVGRYLKEPAADGHAYYQIIDEHDSGLVIEKLDIYDGWSVAMYEGMRDNFPRHYAEQNIAGREALEALFS